MTLGVDTFYSFVSNAPDKIMMDERMDGTDGTSGRMDKVVALCSPVGERKKLHSMHKPGLLQPFHHQ